MGMITMNLKLQKRLASEVLKCSTKRVHFREEDIAEIKEAITRRDIKALADDGAILKKQEKGISRYRARKNQHQKRKGLRKGLGSRKGSKKARSGDKRVWVNKIRVLRGFIRTLRDKEIVAKDIYKQLFSKVKGGFFRSKRHIKVFIEERQLVRKE